MQDFRKHFGPEEKIHIEMTNGFDKHQYVSQIVDHYDGGILDILTPVQKSKIVYFANDSIVKITSSKGDAIYEIKAQLIEKTFGQISMMRLKIISDINKIQRRDFYRLRTILDITIRTIINVNEKKFGEKNKGIAIDISGGGLLLSTSAVMEENDFVELTLHLPEDKETTQLTQNDKYKTSKELAASNTNKAPTSNEIVLIGTIVRKHYDSNAKVAYEYGIRFEKISDFERNEITKFIFNEQRRLIKKGLV
jgi:c-di-GMP-binding flagellar brake protein YcgR